MQPRNYIADLTELSNKVRQYDMKQLQEAAYLFEMDFQRLAKIGIIMRYLVERGEINDAPKGVRILYGKISDCLYGIVALLGAGYPGPAAMVLRSLFETAVNLQVILKQDVEERCRLFDDFIYVQASRIEPGPGIDEQILKKSMEDFERVKKNYHPEKPTSWCWKIAPSKQIRKKVPNNPTFRELCDHIGHPEYYDILYGRISAVIHCTPSYENWMRRSDGKMELGPKFLEITHHIADLTIKMIADSLAQLIFYLHPEDQEPLVQFILNQAI